MKNENVSDGLSQERRDLEADLLVRKLAEQDVPPMSPAHAKYLRQRVGLRIDQIAARAKEHRGVVRFRRVLALAVAAAVVVGLAVFGIASWPTHGQAQAVAQVALLSGSVEIGAGSSARSPRSLALVPVSTGEDLRTGENGSARASLATGTSVEIAPLTRLRFAPSGSLGGRFDDQIVLEYGRIEIQVPRLSTGVTVSIRTHDALVTVHGTRFSVERRATTDGDPGETRVSVTEGQVSVRHAEKDLLLGGGQTWSSRDLGPAAQKVEAPVSSDEVAAEPPAPSPETPKSAPRSTLSAQNELLEHAIDARRRGQPKQAVEQLDRLLARYPDSPLAEIARVERMRTLGAIGDAKRAGAEARRYLKDYPHGFARKEAESIAGVPQ
jgi:hypothetical protein